MQHLDEGTIHSWLDDALGAEEAARVESHVAECAECAAKVAEARGFIAASSRILTALDDVPRGVIPTARPRVARFGPAWRVAAAVLVVAGGSVLVLRNNEQGQDAVTATTTLSAPGTESAAARSESAAVSIADRMQTNSAAPPVAPLAPESRRSSVTTQRSTAPRPDRVAETTKESRRGAVAGVQGGMAGASTIRLLSDSSGTASRSFRYAVGGSDTVTLTEMAQVVRLRGTRSLDAASAPAAAAKTAQAKESRIQTPSASLPAPPAPPLPVASQAAPTAGAGFDRAETAPVINTIRWVDSATGKTLTLSGKLSVARLEEIRRQIERQRATTEKKTP